MYKNKPQLEMVSCAVKGCKNFSERKCEKKFRYYIFPKNPEHLRKWILACGRGKPFITANARICSDHFTNNDWQLQDTLLNTPLTQRKLKFGAIPTRNLPTVITKGAGHDADQEIKIKCGQSTSAYNCDLQKIEYTDLSIEQSNSDDMTDPEYLLPDYGNTDQKFDYEKADDSFETEELNGQNENTKKTIRIWTNSEVTTRLMGLFNDLKSKVGIYRQFHLKKDMHSYIAKKLYEEFGEQYTGEQICTRIKTIEKRRNRELLKQKNVQNSSEIDVSNNLESLYDVDEDEDHETENENDSANTSKKFTNQQSRKLIRLYNMFIPNVRNQFKTHKEAWEAISDELEFEFGVKYTGVQCYQKYKTIVRKAKTLLARKKIKPKSKMAILENIKTSSKAWDFPDQRSIYIKGTDSILEDENNFPYHQTKNESSYKPLFNESTRNEIETHEYNDFKPSNTNLLDIMKEFIEFKKQEIHRHEQTMEQLRKINKTLLDIKNQRNS